MICRAFGGCMALLWTIATPAFADTHYVSLAGHGVSPYTNWYDAATDISLATAAAANGETILVSNGVYHLVAPAYIWGASSLIVSGLYGAAETILDGGGGAFAGISVGWGCTTAWVYNLTITNCGGSGARCNGNTVYLNGCVIAGNTSDRGGGIYGGTRLYVTNCLIRGNSATVFSHYAGGGIYRPGVGVCQVYNSTISGNKATNGSSYGGGVYMDGGGEFHNCVISGNNAGTGGGICADLATSLYVNACTVALNYASAGGGLSGASGMTVHNSTIASNTASQGGGFWGGGMIANCVIRGNTAGNVGGACRSAGVISNCTITGNFATNSGGGLYLPSIVINCLIADNRTGGSGGGINAANSLIQNCTIVSNSSTGNGGGITGSGYCTNSIVYFNSGAGSYSNYQTMSFAYSCTAPLPAGAGNTAVDPKMVNMPADCHLLKGSLCINAGTNDFSWMNGAVDLDGRARIREGTVDMGAYEYFPCGTVFTVY